MKRLIRWSNDIVVQTLIGCGPPSQAALLEERLETGCLEGPTKADDGIAMHQPSIDQFTKKQPGASRRLKMIYIRTAVGVHLCHERRNSGKRIEVGPGDNQPRCTRNGHQMNTEIGRAPRCQQGHNGVHKTSLVDHISQWQRLRCGARHLGNVLRRSHRQAFP